LFAAVVDSVVPRPGIDDAEAKRRHEFVERLSDNGTHGGLIAIAPHGGDIEPHTDAQADRVAERLAEYGVSTWLCKGFEPAGGGALRLFHITATNIHEGSFPALVSVIGRGFRYAVAFHGFRDEGILVGGGAPFRLRSEIARSIGNALSSSTIPVRIAGPGDVLGGDSPRNIVNQLTTSKRGGIHLEQSRSARTEHALHIADAVAEVFAARLRRPRRWWFLRELWDRLPDPAQWRMTARPGHAARSERSGAGVGAGGAVTWAGSVVRLSSSALTATKKLEPDIDRAAISGRRVGPAQANAPAATGSAMVL